MLTREDQLRGANVQDMGLPQLPQLYGGRAQLAPDVGPRHPSHRRMVALIGGSIKRHTG